jgi:predicted kinase
MRKWMSERLKRRKKGPEKPGTEPAPAPLQPAFYDTEPAHSESAVEEDAAAATGPGQSEAVDTQTDEPQGVQSRPGGNGEAGKRRRRRGRGGRSRSRNGAAASGTNADSTPAIQGARSDGASETSVPQPSHAASKAVSPPAQTDAPRPSKGVVVLAIGLPGSGKSSWFKRHNITPLSSDLLRALLFDDPTEQRFQDLIFSNLRSMLKARLIARRPMNYVDATNLSPHERNGWIKLAKDYNYEVQAVFFDVPVEVCIERNQRRERKVPEDAMRRMAGKLKQPTFDEGFSKITVVKVKKKD